MAALLLLGACSSEPTPLEPEPSRSVTSTPTATPPPMPDQAEQDSPEGAAAFVKHYVDVFNYAAATGDVEELSRLSSPDCEGCQSYIDLYRKTYEDGGYFKGGEWKIGKLVVQMEAEAAYLTTTVDVNKGAFKEDSQSSEKPDVAEKTKVSFAVTSKDGAWLLTQIGLGEVQ